MTNPAVQAQRPAFTLLELLVAVAVVAIALALTIPAVQSARAQSRRLACSNNLRQVSVASQTYESTHGLFFGGPRVFRSLLPMLGVPDGVPLDGAIARLSASPESTLCPSDEHADAGQLHGSYRVCDGDARARHRGLRRPYGSLPAAAVTDGLSMTAAFSERLITPDDRLDRTGRPRLVPADADPRFIRWWLPRKATSPEDRISLCLRREGPAEPLLRILNAGFTTHEQTFDTGLPPNVPGCLGAMSGDLTGAFAEVQVVPASSRHGGANVAMGDGAVRFVSDGVDAGVWTAAGTAAGGELSDVF